MQNRSVDVEALLNQFAEVAFETYCQCLRMIADSSITTEAAYRELEAVYLTSRSELGAARDSVLAIELAMACDATFCRKFGRLSLFEKYRHARSVDPSSSRSAIPNVLLRSIAIPLDEIIRSDSFVDPSIMTGAKRLLQYIDGLLDSMNSFVIER